LAAEDLRCLNTNKNESSGENMRKLKNVELEGCGKTNKHNTRVHMKTIISLALLLFLLKVHTILLSSCCISSCFIPKLLKYVSFISVLPSIDIQPKRPIINESSGIVLTCIGEGEPKPLVSWETQYLNSSFYVRSRDDGSTVDLVITSANASDSGWLICTARNVAGITSDTMLLQVNCKNNIQLSSSNASLLLQPGYLFFARISFHFVTIKFC
jgi:hypothetical protein